MAKVDIPPNKAFLFVPYSITISLYKAKKSQIAHLFQEHQYWFQTHPKGDDHIMWTYILFEKLRGADSFWFPYFDTVHKSELAIDWNEIELSELQDPIMLDECQQWQEKIEKT